MSMDPVTPTDIRRFADERAARDRKARRALYAEAQRDAAAIVEIEKSLDVLAGIEEIRPRVLSDETRADLRELMRFRHFKRYYLEFDYDWDKLQFLRRKLEHARPRVREELERFDATLRKAEGP